MKDESLSGRTSGSAYKQEHSMNWHLPYFNHVSRWGPEYELDASGNKTGRWRKRQFYAMPGVLKDTRVPSQRTACEWRGAKK